MGRGMDGNDHGARSGSRLVALVVDDAPSDRRLASAIAKDSGYDVLEAEDARSALALARAEKPDVMLLDIWLPDTDGLSVLSEIHDERPSLPVVIVTASDDEVHVKEALNLGAVNFVQKPITREEVGFVLDRIALAIKEEANLQGVLELVTERRTVLAFDCDPSLLGRVVSYLGREVDLHYPGFDVPLADIKLALYEALANALEHGNLEISFEQKTQALEETGGLEALVKQRLADPTYGSRRIHVSASYEKDRVEYRIRDEGQGFNPADFEELRSLSSTTALHGRGLALIRHYMDDVDWAKGGSEIVLVRKIENRTKA
jgi:DNA-binding response OmpR family regulator